MFDFDAEVRGFDPQPGAKFVYLDFSPFLLHLVASSGLAALEPVGAKQVLGCHLGLFEICNAYKCPVIGRRSVAV